MSRAAALLCLLSMAVWAASFVVGFGQALTLLVLVGFGLAMLGLRYPTLGLFGIGIICTLDPLMGSLLLTGGLLRWNTFNYWLLVVIALHFTFVLRLNDLQTRLFQLLVLLLGLEVIISPDPVLGTQVVLSLLTLFGLLIYIARAQTNQHAWVDLAFINGTLAAVGGLTIYLQMNSLAYLNPNIWSFFPLTGLFTICLAWPTLNASRRVHLTLLLLAMINISWVFLTSSRGSLLLAACCLLYLLAQQRGLVQRLFIPIAIGLLSLIVTLRFPELQQHTLDRIELLVDPHASLRSRTSGRSELLIGGYYMFLAHPLGVGTGGFAQTWKNLGNLEGLGTFYRGIAFPAHATWIKIMAENGLPGGLLLGSYVLSFTLTGWRKRINAHIMLGTLTSAVLCIAFMIIEVQWAKGIWLLASGSTVMLNQRSVAAHLHGAATRTPIINVSRLERRLE